MVGCAVDVGAVVLVGRAIVGVRAGEAVGTDVGVAMVAVGGIVVAVGRTVVAVAGTGVIVAVAGSSVWVGWLVGVRVGVAVLVAVAVTVTVEVGGRVPVGTEVVVGAVVVVGNGVNVLAGVSVIVAVSDGLTVDVGVCVSTDVAIAVGVRDGRLVGTVVVVGVAVATTVGWPSGRSRFATLAPLALRTDIALADASAVTRVSNVPSGPVTPLGGSKVRPRGPVKLTATPATGCPARFRAVARTGKGWPGNTTLWFTASAG